MPTDELLAEVLFLRKRIVGLEQQLAKSKAKRTGDPVARLHNICDFLSEQAAESPFTREEWERIHADNKGLNLEIVNLRGQLAELQRWVSDLQSGMYVNCVYCGHRYGPGETTPVSMADALKAHVEKCEKHPMSTLRAKLNRLTIAAQNVKKYWDNEDPRGPGVYAQHEQDLVDALAVEPEFDPNEENPKRICQGCGNEIPEGHPKCVNCAR